MHVHDVFNISSLGFCLVCFCVGTRVPWHAYGGQTAYRNRFPPSTCESWASAYAAVPLPTEPSCWACVCLGSTALCLQTLGCQRKTGSSLFHHVCSRNGVTSGLAHAPLFSTPLLPLHYVFLGGAGSEAHCATQIGL